MNITITILYYIYILFYQFYSLLSTRITQAANAFCVFTKCGPFSKLCSGPKKFTFEIQNQNNRKKVNNRKKHFNEEERKNQLKRRES